MPHRPTIGVPTQTQEPAPGNSARWSIGQPYVRALTGAGAVPWLIPLLHNDEDTLRQVYDRLDGVLLAGGADLDPANYDESRHLRCGPVDPPRDWVELRLARWAAHDGKPLFGICRGIQTINVALGGTLFQDLRVQFSRELQHDHLAESAAPDRRRALVHEVRILPKSELGRIVNGETAAVNSMHHQGIKDLAPALQATAWAPDGLIEAVESRDGSFLLGVQWHPEELVETRPDAQRLFAAFVDACRKF